jgi:hypothetical protein
MIDLRLEYTTNKQQTTHSRRRMRRRPKPCSTSASNSAKRSSARSVFVVIVRRRAKRLLMCVDSFQHFNNYPDRASFASSTRQIDLTRLPARGPSGAWCIPTNILTPSWSTSTTSTSPDIGARQSILQLLLLLRESQVRCCVCE